MEKNKKITAEQYREGIYDICSFLYSEMKYFLEKENRYYGKVKSFMNNLRDAFQSSDQKITEDDLEVYGRVLYIVRFQIYKDFSRLGQKRLSAADRIIVIIKKLLDLSENIPIESEEEYRFERETRTIKKVITRMFENIRNRAKEDSLYTLSNLVTQSVSEEKYGKISYNTFDLISIEYPKPKELVLKGEETLMSSESTSVKKKEITL